MVEVKIDPKGLKVGRRGMFNLLWAGPRSELDAIEPGKRVASGTFFFDVRGKTKKTTDLPAIAQLRNGFEVEVSMFGEHQEPDVGVWPSDRRRWGRSVAEQAVSISYQVDRSLIDKLNALLVDTVIAEREAEDTATSAEGGIFSGIEEVVS